MAYASVQDVQKRMTRNMTEEEMTVCNTLLDDVAVLIDIFNSEASDNVKKIVSCRAISRTLGSGESIGIPAGASQGSMSALGYSQSWTIGSNGTMGELYLSKLEKQLLGAGNKIGSHSPVEDLCCKRPEV